MPIVECEAKIVGVRYTCDVCGKGEMEYIQGVVLPTKPPLYPHQCANPECATTANLPTPMPAIKYMVMPRPAPDTAQEPLPLEDDSDPDFSVCAEPEPTAEPMMPASGPVAELQPPESDWPAEESVF